VIAGTFVVGAILADLIRQGIVRQSVEGILQKLSCPIFQEDSMKDFPSNPDEWVPPEGVKEELKAKEGSGGKNRQWKDPSGKTVRRFDKGTPGKPSWGGIDHWHDETGRHVLPNR
jgi:hypothetical protein